MTATETRTRAIITAKAKKTNKKSFAGEEKIVLCEWREANVYDTFNFPMCRIKCIEIYCIFVRGGKKFQPMG